jgi:hypothetical protein
LSEKRGKRLGPTAVDNEQFRQAAVEKEHVRLTCCGQGTGKALLLWTRNRFCSAAVDKEQVRLK